MLIAEVGNDDDDGDDDEEEEGRSLMAVSYFRFVPNSAKLRKCLLQSDTHRSVWLLFFNKFSEVLNDFNESYLKLISKYCFFKIRF